MRTLKKDKKKLYISKRLPSVPVLDENGFEIENCGAVWLGVKPSGILSDSDTQTPINNNYYCY